MKRVAIIMTVFNRKDVTIRGLQMLLEAIKMTSGYKFEVFLTEDGCTDGTVEAIQKLFPSIIILHGTGHLYWGGGMNLAWKAALNRGGYDYYIWYNDDAELFANALNLLFAPMTMNKGNMIVCGAFRDENGNPSYGGRDQNKNLLAPNGKFRKVTLMNGNLTLIPHEIVESLGVLDKIFIHIGGDWDYGLRAIRKGIPIVLTQDYVGITNRHDIKRYEGNLMERWSQMLSVKHNPLIVFRFNIRHFGLLEAMSTFGSQILLACFPNLKR